MEFFDGMAQKTKNISEIMKLTAAISSEKERQEKIYRELGETYYKVYGDRAESELMEMCTQIRESRETVENYEKEILALKGIVVCPACGYEVSIHFNFCNNCGHKMKEIQEEQPSVDELIEEGEALKQEEEVIASGEFVKEILAEEKSVECESEPEKPECAEEPGEPEEVTDMEDLFLRQMQEAVDVSSERVCKVCGAQMEEDQEFCIMCGTKYGEECREEAEEKKEEPQERICSKCGSIVKPGHLFCMECGTKQ